MQAQIEGCVIQTTSRTLTEDLALDRKVVTSLCWASYPIMRFKDVPEVQIDLIKRSNDAPRGVGEPAAVGVFAAISTRCSARRGSGCGRSRSNRPRRASACRDNRLGRVRQRKIEDDQ